VRGAGKAPLFSVQPVSPFLARDVRISRLAAEAADAGRWLCCIPVIALVEIALLRERGRVAVTPQEVMQALGGRPGYAVLATDAEQALQFAGLVGVKDPIDRLVLAAARAASARLVSIDAEPGPKPVD
jgi:PIN domain nuclease of toxin-antitoxin system